MQSQLVLKPKGAATLPWFRAAMRRMLNCNFHVNAAPVAGRGRIIFLRSWAWSLLLKARPSPLAIRF